MKHKIKLELLRKAYCNWFRKSNIQLDNDTHSIDTWAFDYDHMDELHHTIQGCFVLALCDNINNHKNKTKSNLNAINTAKGIGSRPVKSRVALANALVAIETKITATLSQVEAIFQVQMFRLTLHGFVVKIKIRVTCAQTGLLTICGTMQILTWQAGHVRVLALFCQTWFQIRFVFLFKLNRFQLIRFNERFIDRVADKLTTVSAIPELVAAIALIADAFEASVESALIRIIAWPIVNGFVFCLKSN